MTHLDGNAAAGPLSEIFTAEVTTATVTCGACGATGALAGALLYEGAGTVLRCPSCEAVLLRLVRRRGETCVEMCGVRMLRLSTPDRQQDRV